LSNTTRRVLAAGGFVVAVLAAATGIETIRQGQAQGIAASQQAQVAAPPSGAAIGNVDVVAALSGAFRRATHAALPAVVSVEVEGRQRVTESQNPFRGMPFFDDPRGGQAQPMRGSGSGFVFRADGYILTNNHVVQDADRITIRYQDGREMTAKVVGRDPQTDIAVVKVDATDLATVDLGNSDAIDVGDWVVALGYPLQLGNTATVTAGIVSAMGRNLGILARNENANERGTTLEHYIQTDAAINPGNSGGPLIDLNGKVIGVNSAIASPTGYFSGYGFAVPINIARNVANDLINHGEVRRPRLGVQVGSITEADREVFKLNNLEGAKVTQVTPGLPAEKAGLELGDVIVSLNGEPIHDSGQLTAQLAEKFEPGDKVTLGILRYGKRMNINIELARWSEPNARPERVTRGEETAKGSDLLGFSAADITPQISRQLDFQARQGVVVTEVDDTGSARVTPLSPGSVVEQFNGKPVRSVEDLDRAASSLKAGDVVSLIVRMPPDGTRTLINYRIRE
jgi:serine protease Do